MTAAEIKKVLNENIVTFTYTKKDGSLRTAIGTTNDSFLSKVGSSPRGGDNKVKGAGYISYYDTTSKGWRCFAESKFSLVKTEAL